MPRGDGRKSGERRVRLPKEGFTPYVPKGLNARLQDWSTIKDKEAFTKPGSQNPRKS